ncbi:MAG: alpha/beta hydrolase [Planctomycetota bacterium]
MRFFIPGPVGRLEALLWMPKDGAAPRAAAVVCHPLPTAGGTMDNNVVFRIARGLQHAGLAVLRFNFRSAGASEGVHDGKGAEEGDVRAALDHLERGFPGLELWAAGFSFGSRTVGSLARSEARIRRVALIAPPAKAYDCRFVREIPQPTLIVHAEHDEFGTPGDFDASVGPLPAHFERIVIPGVEHFFRGANPELEATIKEWAERSLQPT